jgi:hypothetical protein
MNRDTGTRRHEVGLRVEERSERPRQSRIGHFDETLVGDSNLRGAPGVGGNEMVLSTVPANVGIALIADLSHSTLVVRKGKQHRREGCSLCGV